MTLKDYSEEYETMVYGKNSFLHKHPDILKETKKLLKEAEELGMSDTALAIYSYIYICIYILRVFTVYSLRSLWSLRDSTDSLNNFS